MPDQIPEGAVAASIHDLTDALVAEIGGVIVATALSGASGDWHVELRSGTSYLAKDRAMAVRGLERLRTVPVPARAECTDTTCCLSCEYPGSEHSAGECWVMHGDDQCPCGWYSLALMAHRHAGPNGDIDA